MDYRNIMVSNGLEDVVKLNNTLNMLKHKVEIADDKLKIGLEAFQEVCMHPFVVRRPLHNGLVSQEPTISICILCGAEEQSYAPLHEHMKLQPLRKVGNGFRSGCWWCFLVDDEGEFELDIEKHRALILHPELAVKSWEKLCEQTENNGYTQATLDKGWDPENEEIPFIKFCHETAQRYNDAHSKTIPAVESE